MNTPRLTFTVDSRLLVALRHRLGKHAPEQIYALGRVELLALPKTALFCSALCPGDAILRAYDQAAHWRDTGRCIISGFHSPVEQECLRILLRGTQPVIACPARSLPQRIPADWQQPIAEGRMLIRAFCNDRGRRVTTALADEVCIVHAAVGGNLELLAPRLRAWGIRLDSPQLRPTAHD